MNSQPLLSLWYVKALIVLIMVGILLSLAAYTKLTLREAKYGQYGMTSINVRGEGEVMARPDIGTFSFSVMAEGSDAATAQSDSAERTNAILAYLEEAGVEEKDIKTTNYYLNPRYRYEARACPTGSYCPPGNPIIDGYEVTQSVEVKVRDLDLAGDLITGAGERGASNISSLSFTVDDTDTLKSEAREAAIADAKEKAEILADELGVSLVRIMGYYEDEGHMPYEYGMGGDAKMTVRSEAAVAPNLPTGESATKSVVNITYEVR
ncbi:MAG: SIMPL domain-containing protein [Candidatus Paceibacterota bacterium]